MAFESGLTALILADGPTAALIGTNLFPVTGIIDGALYPYVTYQEISGSSFYTFDGSELRTNRMQLDIWSATYATNKSIIIALRNLLSGYTGTLNDGTRILFADRLSVSVSTIRTHLQHIYHKLHVRSRTEAVIKYLH